MRERPLAHNFARPVEQADLVLCRAPVDASEPAECLISHGPVLSCSTSRHDACRNLYGRSRARLPTGHPSWPACRGTDPRLVLVARVHGWSLPAGRLARSAYTRTDRAFPGYRCTDRLVGVEELGGVGERPFLALDAHRAVQAEPGLPPPHPSTAAQGHELAGLRRQLTAAGQPDDVVHR